jgi:8-amino-7-oxononanoate synthase
MADLFDKIHNDEVIRRAKEATEFGMYPYFRALSDSEGTTATFEGKRVIMLGSNNYLGLTTDPRVRQAAVEAVQRYGTSVTGIRVILVRFRLFVAKTTLSSWIKMTMPALWMVV